MTLFKRQRFIVLQGNPMEALSLSLFNKIKKLSRCSHHGTVDLLYLAVQSPCCQGVDIEHTPSAPSSQSVLTGI